MIMSSLLKYLVGCLIFGFVLADNDGGESSVQLELYYEALCPGCTKFVTTQLYPTWKKLHEYGILSVFLYPFGNARETRLPNGTYQYNCQHGEEECRGNIIEACIIKGANNDANIFMPTIACIEDNVQSGKPVEDAFDVCVGFFMAKKSGSGVRECADGPEGIRLMHKIAVRTNQLEPPHNYVPWLTFNGIHREDYNDEAMSNLLGLVCDLYKGTSKPKICVKSFHPNDVHST